MGSGGGGGSSAGPAGGEGWAVEVRDLEFSYPGTFEANGKVLEGCRTELPRGARALLVGGNGSGKSTALQVLAGQFLVPEGRVRVLGRPAFHDTSLVCSGALSFLGGTWRHDVAFAGYGIPHQGDFRAGDMVRGVPGVDPARCERLLRILDVDEDWSMARVSDGQRRRVQICMGLLKPYQVLLLDEITVDLDLVGRLDLLEFFRAECEERGATVVYATHIFDGLDGWATHLVYVGGRRFQRAGEVGAIEGLAGRRLLPTVEKWLRESREEAREEEQGSGMQMMQPSAPSFPSRHMAFFR